MKESRLVLWPQHGIYGAGRDMDEVFGLIETAEKPLKCTLMFVRKEAFAKQFQMQIYGA